MQQQLIIALILWSAIGAAGLVLAFAVDWLLRQPQGGPLHFLTLALDQLPRQLRVPAMRTLGAMMTLGALFGFYYNLTQYREIRRHRSDVETLRADGERERITSEIDAKMRSATELWRRKDYDESLRSAEDALKLAEEKLGTGDPVTEETRKKVEKARTRSSK